MAKDLTAITKYITVYRITVMSVGSFTLFTALLRTIDNRVHMTFSSSTRDSPTRFEAEEPT